MERPRKTLLYFYFVFWNI